MTYVLFREPSPSLTVEAEIDEEDSRGNDEVAHDELENTEGWDEVLIDDEEDDVEMVLKCD